MDGKSFAEMKNTLDRANWWRDFICTKCQFPAPERLRAQFSVAELCEFCDCGCNSFKVRVPPASNVEPIATNGGYGLVFEADFRLGDDNKTLEVLLFSDGNGNLAYVEIDCCGNNFPVPDTISIAEPPYNVHSSLALIV